MADSTINIFGSSGEAMVGANTINTILASMDSKLTSDDINIETLGDGTVDVDVKNDTYSINLNHTHENMAKLVVCEESELPSTLAKDTIYAQVDDAETPTEIQSLWIAGLEFVGGGGGVVDDTPKLNTPRPGATIDFDGQSTTTLVVKGKNLISNLSVAVTGDFTVTANGQSVSTIAAADVTDGASLTLTLTQGSTFDFHGGSLVISSTDLTEQVSVRVIDSQASPVPAGYTRLNSVKLVGNNMINPQIAAIGTSWRLKVVLMVSGNAEVLISRGTSVKGAYFGMLSSTQKWGLAGDKLFSDISMGTEIEVIVSFSNSNTISVTIGDTTLTQEQTQLLTVNHILLFNTDNYPFMGYIHEVECTNGALCHLYPAKRISDNEVGLYDAENGTFYTGFEQSNI